MKHEWSHRYTLYSKFVQCIKVREIRDAHYIQRKRCVFYGRCYIFFITDERKKYTIGPRVVIEFEPVNGFFLLVVNIQNIGIATDVDEKIYTSCVQFILDVRNSLCKCDGILQFAAGFVNNGILNIYTGNSQVSQVQYIFRYFQVAIPIAGLYIYR